MDQFIQSDEAVEADLDYGVDYRMFDMDANTYAADVALDSLEAIADATGDTELNNQIYLSRINLTLNS